MTNRSHWLPWGDFAAAVRSGQTQVPKLLGGNLFEYFQSCPEAADEFTGAMAGLTAMWAPDVAGHLDTTGVKVAVDVGGANGALVRLCSAPTRHCAGSSSTAPTSRPRWRPNSPAIGSTWSAATSSSGCPQRICIC